MSATVAPSTLRRRLKMLVEGYERSWDTQTWVERAYFVGLMGVLGIFLSSAANQDNPLIGSITTATALLLASALAYECYAWAAPRASRFWVNIAFGALTAIGGVFASAFAAEAVNAATGFDPAHFGHTKLLLALLMTLPLTAFGIVLISIPAMLVVTIKTVSQVARTKGRSQERHAWVGLGRLMAVLLSATMANHLVQPNAWLDPRFPEVAAWSAYTMDMHPDKRCATASNARVTRVNDTLVLLGEQTSTGYTFSLVTCQRVADPLKGR